MSAGSDTPIRPPSEDGGDESQNELLAGAPTADQEGPTTTDRDRAALAAGAELSPMTLVGSYFHRVENGTMVWQGIVVGEPQAGKYLCQIDGSLPGADRAKVQVVVTLDAMLAKDEGYEWRFYDTAEEMRAAFAEYATTAEGVDA